MDLDLGLHAAALLLSVPKARSLDGLMADTGSWTARLTFAPRFEVRLGRQVRALVGAEAGAVIRPVPYESDRGRERLSGVWWGASLGLVVTPP